ncbi:MAG: thioredoxin domain-containing protein [Patescibacteria group bacterium]
MASSEQVQKGFLLGAIVLVVLIVIGIIWAIASGPSPVAPVSFNDTNDPSIGAQTDKVVRIFGDLQCPACRSAEAGVHHVRDTYGSQVKIVWNDYPLPSLHPNAMEAANAARCAEDQGKFWEYHDKLYDDQPSWDSLADPTQKFVDYATALDLQGGNFKACLDGRKNQSKINDDMSEGDRIGVNATPTFYVGSKQIVGGLSDAQWDAEIQVLLAQPAATSTTP